LNFKIVALVHSYSLVQRLGIAVVALPPKGGTLQTESPTPKLKMVQLLIAPKQKTQYIFCIEF